MAGGSSSGKTTVAERLAELAGADSLALIKLDSYYVHLAGTLEERKAFNYDHPDAFDWPLLNDHLAALARGTRADVPVYDYVAYEPLARAQGRAARQDRGGRGDPRAVGTSSCVSASTSRCSSTPTPTCASSAASSATCAERGRTVQSVIDQYLATVRPAHEQFIEPSKRHADVIVPKGGLNRPALDVLLARVRELAGPDY